MAKKRGLGKGLDALLGDPAEISTALNQNKGNKDALKTLPVDLLQRSQYQPRKDFNKKSLQELADSINAQGMVQPIIVRAIPRSKKFEIIAGERRWRAAQMAGIQDIPVVIKDVPDKTVMCIALIENIQRQDLNPLEEARAMDRLIKEFEMTHDAVAEAVGRSRSAVTNILRLLDLSAKVKQMLENRKLEMGHARALLTLPAAKQIGAAETVIRQGLSVRATEDLVKRLSGKSVKKKVSRRKVDPNVRKLQDNLASRLAAKVEIKHNKNGKGELKVFYSSLDQLDGILKRIK